MHSLECQRRADILIDLRVLIRRCRIKAVFNTSRDKGIELRVRHTLHSYWGDGGLELSRHQRCKELSRLRTIPDLRPMKPIRTQNSLPLARFKSTRAVPGR